MQMNPVVKSTPVKSNKGKTHSLQQKGELTFFSRSLAWLLATRRLGLPVAQPLLRRAAAAQQPAVVAVGPDAAGVFLLRNPLLGLWKLLG